jgi:hypothetical protein
MIAIVNRTEELSKGVGVYGKGVQIYTLQINNKILTTFDHKFEDGLSHCLYLAAEAAYRWEQKEKVKL